MNFCHSLEFDVCVWSNVLYSCPSHWRLSWIRSLANNSRLMLWLNEQIFWFFVFDFCKICCFFSKPEKTDNMTLFPQVIQSPRWYWIILHLVLTCHHNNLLEGFAKFRFIASFFSLLHFAQILPHHILWIKHTRSV